MKQILSPDNFSYLQAQIQAAIAGGAPKIAAFDADGTLWDTDMGENYFEYIINNNLVDLPPNPMDHYLKMRNGANPPDGYLWLAQILKNKPLEQVQQWNEDCLTQHQPLPLFLEIKRLIDYLQELKFDIYVVTASVKWAVEAPAKAFGIPKNMVIGITTKVKNGVITDEQDGPITWKQGKVTGLLEKTQGIKPLLSVGNSTGDQYLLDSTSHLPIAVRAVPKDHMIFESEQSLAELAESKGWATHDYRLDLRS